MNKKFFTLIASVFVLAGLVGSASAVGIGVGEAASNFKTDKPDYADQKLYQIGFQRGATKPSAPISSSLASTALVLALDDNGVLSVSTYAAYDNPLWQTLWCAQKASPTYQGGLTTNFKFTNKAQSKPLMLSKEQAAQDGGFINVNYGNVSDWGLSQTLTTLQTNMPLYSFYDRTSEEVLILLYDQETAEDYADWIANNNSHGGSYTQKNPNYNAANKPVSNGLYVAKVKIAEFTSAIYSTAGFGALTAGFSNSTTAGVTFRTNFLTKSATATTQAAMSEHAPNVLWATLMKPAPIELSAEAFNTRMGTDPDPDGDNYQTLAWADKKDNNLVGQINPWSSYPLRAIDAKDLMSTATNPVAPANDQLSTALNSNMDLKNGEWLAFTLPDDFEPPTGKEEEKWLRVDTAYSTNGSITQYLTFNFGAYPFGTTTGATPALKSKVEAQYFFKLTYNVFADEVRIDAFQITHNLTPRNLDKDNTGKKWWFEQAAIANTASPITAANTDGYIQYDGVQTNLKKPVGTATGPEKDFALRVSLVDIDNTSGSQLVTVGNINYADTWGTLGVTGCGAASPDYTSIDEGLYTITIRDEDDADRILQIFGVPINTDSVANGKHPVAFYNADRLYDPDYTPSSQWIVQKTLSGSSASPIRIINREFPNIVFDPVQLIDGKSSVGASTLFVKDMFKKVNPELAKDYKLGYFYVDKKVSDVNRYAFQYYHDFNSEYYLGVDDQSRIRVSKAQTEFFLEPVYVIKDGKKDYTGVEYGYRPTDAEKTAGIAQLKRVAYKISVKAKDGNVLSVDPKQKNYVSKPLSEVEKEKTTSGVLNYGVFFLKSYHYTGGKEYHALLDTNSFYGRKPGYNKTTLVADNYDKTKAEYVYNFGGTEDYKPNTNPLHISYTKLSIADGSIVAYANLQGESRTSAFHIGTYSVPLYRRFDNQPYLYGNGEATVTEPFKGDSAKNANSPLWLEFRDMILPNTYLFENATQTNAFRSKLKDTTIHFLGLQDRRIYKDGDEEFNKPYYQFYVDTAFVTRTADGKYTTNKADYTPMPQYMLALRPFIMTEGSLWYASTGETKVQEEKPTTPPDGNDWNWTQKVVKRLVRGMYLFNAQDSVNRGLDDYAGKKEDNILGDVRLAFVDGVHFEDTFYVLPDSAKDSRYAYTKSATIEFQLHPETYLYSLPWYKKHALDKNTHYEPRWYRTEKNGAITTPALPNAKINEAGDAYTFTSTVKASTALNGKSMVFQFRLRNLGQEYGNPDRDFFIESRRPIEDVEIGPDYAYFVNNHQGAPVISTNKVKFQDNAALNDAALGFNVTQLSKDAPEYGDPNFSANEAAQLSDAARVISGVNQISILNAAGKTVTVTNVLGQTVAKTVATSDNATITLPKGIVVVSVDGKSTKAVVK